MLYETQSIHNYLPEKARLEGKDRRPSRVCREAFAVLSVDEDFRILASYGMKTNTDRSIFCAYGIHQKERSSAERAVRSGGRVLVPCQEGTLLIFSDWLHSTGLALTVHLPDPADEVMQTLAMMGRAEFTGVAVDVLSHAHPSDLVIDRLSELLYYLDRILSPRTEIGIVTRAALIAELIGCYANQASLPTAPTAFPQDGHRLTAFLFCALLSLRNESISLSAVGNLRCSLSYREECLEKEGEKTPRSNQKFTWAKHPGFAPFEISVQNNTISMRTHATERALAEQFHAKPSKTILELSISLF